MSSWRVLPLALADQQQHIDLSERLLTEVQAGKPGTLAWNSARPPALILGFSQKPAQLNQTALHELALPIYHRRAGGTAVLVGPQMLSLDVVLPPDHRFVLADVVESYRWLGEAWVTTLAQLGVQTNVVTPPEARAQQALLKQEATRERESILRRACYGSLSPYEVVVGQRKIVGLDMIRRRTGSLLQAGLLLSWETETLARLLGHTPAEQELLRAGLLERAIGLDSLASRVITPEEVIATFETVVGARSAKDALL